MFRKLKEQPPGVYLLFSTELWERFSYYGMLGLLVLFLVAPASAGGFGWDNAHALRIFGSFLAAIWFAPLFGGWLADRVLGARRAVVLGCITLAVGNLCLAGRAFIPDAIDALTGASVSPVFTSETLTLADAWSREAILTAAGFATAPTELFADAVVLTYRLITTALLAGLIFLVVGAGLFKSNVSVLMGGLYPRADDPRRDFGFTIFYMGINAGALLAPLIAGTAGERIGWHVGFLLSTLGMVIGIVIFLATHRRVLGEAGIRVSKQTPASTHDATAEDRRRVLVIAVFALFATVFATGLMMYGGLLNLFAAQQVERTFGSFEVPATWFLTLNPLYIILLGPIVASLWDSRLRTGRAASSIEKFTAGLGLMALGFLVLVVAASGTSVEHKAQWAWIVVFYLVFTTGELCVYPVGLALVSRLAPSRWIGVLMGAWLLTNAVGSWLAGELGALAQSAGTASIFFVVFALAAVSALTLWLGRRHLINLAGTSP